MAQRHEWGRTERPVWVEHGRRGAEGQRGNKNYKQKTDSAVPRSHCWELEFFSKSKKKEPIDFKWGRIII